MHLRLDLVNIPATTVTNIDSNRTVYVVLFLSFLITSLISTALIYYFVRYKKKSYFDASGRKYIEILGGYDMLLELFETIIKNDERDMLEKENGCLNR